MSCHRQAPGRKTDEGTGCMSRVLAVRSLSKSYGDTCAVCGLSFSAHRGEILGLLGPNGAGKTTAIRIIMGIVGADSGSVRMTFDDNSGRRDPRRIGYLPEERGLYEEARVLDNLRYLGRLRGMKPKEAVRRARRWLDRLDLGGWSDRKLQQLSKGMQQKVQFIAAVLHRPDLVVLDEPFAGLDPINQDVFRREIASLRQRGMTVVLSSHQMNLVEELCDRICMLHEGRRVLYGDLADIKRQHPQAMVSVRHKPGADISFVRRFSGVSAVESDAGVLNFRYRTSQGTNRLLDELSRRLHIDEISVQTPPLHDIFTSTVRQGGEPGEGIDTA